MVYAFICKIDLTPLNSNMPKKRIPPEIKAQIIQTIKDNPQITIPELKERFKINDGRIFVGFKKVTVGIEPKIKENPIQKEEEKPAVQETTETEKKN